jgi:hypothetical protein
MLDFLELLKLAKDTGASILTNRNTAKEKTWDDLVLALDKLSELTNVHVKAVAAVTAPLLDEGNLAETTKRYGLLVNNPDFPQGYDSIRGILDGAKRLPRFKSDENFQKGIGAVLDALYQFQYGVFTLSWDSYRVADAFVQCARAVEQQLPAKDMEQAIKPFQNTFTGLFEVGTTEPGILSERVNTEPEVIRVLQRWCQGWQRYIQKILYGGRGLNGAISELKMQRHN